MEDLPCRTQSITASSCLLGLRCLGVSIPCIPRGSGDAGGAFLAEPTKVGNGPARSSTIHRTAACMDTRTEKANRHPHKCPQKGATWACRWQDMGQTDRRAGTTWGACPSSPTPAGSQTPGIADSATHTGFCLRETPWGPPEPSGDPPGTLWGPPGPSQDPRDPLGTPGTLSGPPARPRPRGRPSARRRCATWRPSSGQRRDSPGLGRVPGKTRVWAWV